MLDEDVAEASQKQSRSLIEMAVERAAAEAGLPSNFFAFPITEGFDESEADFSRSHVRHMLELLTKMCLQSLPETRPVCE